MLIDWIKMEMFSQHLRALIYSVARFFFLCQFDGSYLVLQIHTQTKIHLSLIGNGRTSIDFTNARFFRKRIVLSECFFFFQIETPFLFSTRWECGSCVYLCRLSSLTPQKKGDILSHLVFNCDFKLISLFDCREKKNFHTYIRYTRFSQHMIDWRQRKFIENAYHLDFSINANHRGRWCVVGIDIERIECPKISYK